MIYALVGTKKELREKGNKELISLGVVTRYIYSEQVSELESLIDGVSLFGDMVVIVCSQLGEVASSKEELLRLLSKMEASLNIFIIDEPFGDIHMVNRLSKVAEKVYDAREEKIKDVSVFKLCDSFMARDKKQSWIQFMDLRKRESGESIQGALWWKFNLMWQGVREGKKSAFSELECERIGGELLRSSILAHRGKKDLIIELERIILSL